MMASGIIIRADDNELDNTGIWHSYSSNSRGKLSFFFGLANESLAGISLWNPINIFSEDAPLYFTFITGKKLKGKELFVYLSLC